MADKSDVTLFLRSRGDTWISPAQIRTVIKVPDRTLRNPLQLIERPSRQNPRPVENRHVDKSLCNLERRRLLMAALREHIEKRGWTQSEAAKKLGTTQPRISALMKGAWRDFSADMLLVLAARLGLRPTLKLALNAARPGGANNCHRAPLPSNLSLPVAPESTPCRPTAPATNSIAPRAG